MDGYILNGGLGMPRGSLLRIDDGPGVLVYVWEGELWLTQHRGRDDHVLRAGEWFRVERGGATIAHALRRSSISLSTPQGAAPARRITLARSGTVAPSVIFQRSPLGVVHALRKFLAGMRVPRPLQPTIS